MTAISKLTRKYQIIIPAKICKALRLKKGNFVQFELAGNGTVTLKKAALQDATWPKSLESTLTEWESEADEEAYRDL